MPLLFERNLLGPGTQPLLGMMLALILLIIASLVPSSTGWNIGGRSPVDPKLPRVQKAALFAVTQIKGEGEERADKKLVLVNVLRAQEQVVAGYNYFMKLELNNGLTTEVRDRGVVGAFLSVSTVAVPGEVWGGVGRGLGGRGLGERRKECWEV